MPSKDKDGEVPIPKDTQNVSDMDLCAPDSLDPLHGITQSYTVLIWTPRKKSIYLLTMTPYLLFEFFEFLFVCDFVSTMFHHLPHLSPYFFVSKVFFGRYYF